MKEFFVRSYVLWTPQTVICLTTSKKKSRDILLDFRSCFPSKALCIMPDFWNLTPIWVSHTVFLFGWSQIVICMLSCGSQCGSQLLFPPAHNSWSSCCDYLLKHNTKFILFFFIRIFLIFNKFWFIIWPNLFFNY